MTTFTCADFSRYEEIGSGGEGSVFKVETRNFGSVAVKVFSYKVNLREIENMRQFCHHPHIIQFYGVYKADNPFSSQTGIVMKYMPEGSVHHAIHVKKLKYSLEQAYSWIAQASNALAFLHDKQVIHRDVKPANMLLQDSFKTVKISDFGLAKEINNDSTTSFQGSTYRYMPPEMFRNPRDCTYSSDVFSFAISAWEIITKCVPYDDNPKISEDTFELIQGVINGKRPSVEDVSDPHIILILERAWHRDPDVRPKMEKLHSLWDTKIMEQQANAKVKEHEERKNFLNRLKNGEVSNEEFERVMKSYDGDEEDVEEEATYIPNQEEDDEEEAGYISPPCSLREEATYMPN